MAEMTSVKNALRLAERAELKRQLAPPYDPLKSHLEQSEAAEMESVALGNLTPKNDLKVTPEGEVVPHWSESRSGLELALENPDLLSAEVTIQRSDLAEKAGVFEMAHEVTRSCRAKNSVQRMQAHQLAAAHKYAMELLGDASKVNDPAVKVKLINASARLMEAFSKGALALQRLQTGASQVVQVQHVQVNGQAVIGNIGGAG